MINTTVNLTAASKRVILIGLMAVLLLVLMVVSLGTGAVPISPSEIMQVIGGQLGLVSGTDQTHEVVLFSIRLPRLFLTILVGAALGLSGAALQGLFRNPLVEPGIIGVSSGAALGAIVAIMFLGSWVPALAAAGKDIIMPVCAFLGSLAATLITMKLSRMDGSTQITYLILAGVAITSMTGAVIGLSIFFADDVQLRSYTFWTLGDLSVATWGTLQTLAGPILLSCAGLLGLGPALNAIALGEAEAYHAGVAVEKIKTVVVLCSALAVGTAVAFTGIIGFVGLVVPHIIRIGLSSDHRLLLPASAIGGGCLLVLADMFARTVMSPAELPIGVVTALVGTPFFLYLLLATKKKRMI